MNEDDFILDDSDFCFAHNDPIFEKSTAGKMLDSSPWDHEEWR